VVLQVVVHVPVVVLHASPTGQSAALAQPHMPPVRQALPTVPEVQLVQAPPLTPHAVAGTAVEMDAHLLVASQQKPVPQLAPAAPTPQVDVHAPAVEQVGVPPPQGAQAPPLFPHLALSVPATQLGVAAALSQQPPLHAVWLAPHLVSQPWVVVLHELPLGQSAARLQPHALPTHALPAGAVVQSTQLPGMLPQLVVVLAHGAPVRSCPARSCPARSCPVRSPPPTERSLPGGGVVVSEPQPATSHDATKKLCHSLGWLIATLLKWCASGLVPPRLGEVE